MSSQTSRRSIRNEARPLGTPGPKKPGKGAAASAEKAAAKAAKAKQQRLEPDPRSDQSDDDLETAQKDVDSPPTHDVVLAQDAVATNQLPQDAALLPPVIKEYTTMTLTRKGYNKNGKRAIYTGARTTIQIPKIWFVDGVAPETLEVNGPLVGVRQPKVKLTKEERAALPKPTLAERARKAAIRAAKLAELAAQEARAQEQETVNA